MTKNNKKKPQWAYVIGRFQIPHNPHFTLIESALEFAERVIVFVGSAKSSRSALNPFDEHERIAMLKNGLPQSALERIVFCPIEDFWDNQKWVESVQAHAQQIAQGTHTAVLVGHKKDFSSRYLDTLKADFHEIGSQGDISATSLRNIYFLEGKTPASFDVLKTLTRQGVVDYLKAYSHTEQYAWLCKDYKATAQYQERWGRGPHLTADALVSCAGRVLLVQRGGDIGHDLWALPGGFVEPHEDFFPAAVRELQEETQIAVTPSLLDTYLVSDKVFSHPRRSSRGRIVTRAYYFNLPHFETPPEVRPADDAKDCKWISISELKEMRSQMFEDHFHIISSFLENALS